jgi:hypothetical protein
METEKEWRFISSGHNCSCATAAGKYVKSGLSATHQRVDFLYSRAE